MRQTYQTVAGNRNPPYLSSEIGRGFEAEDYEWTTDGNYSWSRVTDSSYDGEDSSRSCEMTGETTSWTETNVIGPATLAFKLRLRTYGGFFNVLTDGAISYTCGDSSTAFYGNSWESVAVSIPSGRHTVRLAYTHPGIRYVSGGNGAWIDQLSFRGGAPVRGETTTTEVPVPHSWLSGYYPTDSTSDYETRAAQRGANGYYVWQSYVAGLDPTDPTSLFTVRISMTDGKPVVTYEPELSAEEAAKRTYTVYGKKRMDDTAWSVVSSGEESLYRFFMVSVEMK